MFLKICFGSTHTESHVMNPVPGATAFHCEPELRYVKYKVAIRQGPRCPLTPLLFVIFMEIVQISDILK